MEGVTIAELDDRWQTIAGTHKTYAVDTVLVAVGLAEVNEFYLKARQWGMDVYAAGDAQEIAEASAAMFTGRIEGLKVAKALGCYSGRNPGRNGTRKAVILKSRPGTPVHRDPPVDGSGRDARFSLPTGSALQPLYLGMPGRGHPDRKRPDHRAPLSCGRR